MSLVHCTSEKGPSVLLLPHRIRISILPVFSPFPEYRTHLAVAHFQVRCQTLSMCPRILQNPAQQQGPAATLAPPRILPSERGLLHTATAQQTSMPGCFTSVLPPTPVLTGTCGYGNSAAQSGADGQLGLTQVNGAAPQVPTFAGAAVVDRSPAPVPVGDVENNGE